LLTAALIASAQFGLALTFILKASRRLGFSHEDRLAALFCGSQKSLASGAPTARILFAGSPDLGLIVLPLMFYHQLQLMVCSSLARRFAQGPRDPAAQPVSAR
jgi:sodium/bile acid cotransporter 7